MSGIILFLAMMLGMFVGMTGNSDIFIAFFIMGAVASLIFAAAHDQKAK